MGEIGGLRATVKDKGKRNGKVIKNDMETEHTEKRNHEKDRQATEKHTLRVSKSATRKQTGKRRGEGEVGKVTNNG